MSEESVDGTEWLIHRFECPDCGATTRSDRCVKCYRCGSEMEHSERIGEVTDTVDTGTESDSTHEEDRNE